MRDDLFFTEKSTSDFGTKTSQNHFKEGITMSNQPTSNDPKNPVPSNPQQTQTNPQQPHKPAGDKKPAEQQK
jgi:hypothetical protein